MFLPAVSKLRHLCNRTGSVGRGQIISKLSRPFSASSSRDDSSNRLGGKVLSIPQGGNLVVDFSNAVSAKINITSKWQDFCQISSGHPRVEAGSVDVQNNLCEISLKEEDVVGGGGKSENSNSNTEPFLDITVPEIINLTIIGNHLDLNMKNKLMGDIDIICSSGTVNIDKVRGESLNFNCGQADVKILKLMEGTSSVACRSFYGKMVNGADIKIISMQDVTIEAMYGDNSSINCMRNVHIDLAKGITNVNANGAAVLKGIDGKFDVRAKGKIDVQINKLSPGSRSSAISSGSTVSAKADPDLTYTLECRSDTSTARNSITIVSEGFTKRDDSSSSSSSDGGDVAIDQDSSPSSIQTISGIVIPSKKSNKRPDFDIKSKGSGKIDISGAEAQSLNAVAKEQGGGHSGPSSSPTSPEESALNDNENHPFLLLSSRGHIRVESLSWIEAIVRSHGLEDVYQHISSDKLKVGRTASSSSRAREILKESETLAN